MHVTKKIVGSLLLVAVALSATLGTALASSITGPNSSQSPYILRSQPGVITKAIFTVGDSVNLKPSDSSPYRMVGIPDGLGAFDNGDGTFTVLMNHELGASAGITRVHGARGAFISKWIIRTEDLAVLSGEDLIRDVKLWTPGGYQSTITTFSRFCSADLPEISAFYDSASGLGYNGRIYLNGEESGAEGRALAHLLDGTSYELPWLGKFSWENSVANPTTGLKTVVAGLDDSGNGQVYFYVGTKTNASSPVEAAGLTNGILFSLKVNGLLKETDSTVVNGPVSFTAHNFGNVAYITGAQLESLSNANGVTAFNRPEDGAWDPNNPNDFYFVSTASFTGKSRLWRVHFNNPADPAAGGTVEVLLDGSEGQKMMDNLTFNKRGQLVIQEDPGNQAYIARIWLYDVATDKLVEVAHHDPDRFAPGAPNFLTQDEESSGIIDVSAILGEGWYLLVQQAHYATDSELVEGGQLLALHIPPGKKFK